MRSELAVVAACLVCAFAGGYLALASRRLRERFRARDVALRGASGERSAERMLEARGYRICARQLRTTYCVDVDRAPHEVELVLDLVVERGGERCVAEVKTGRFAPRYARADTRRQLLEYQLATGSSRVLLVDPEAETITELAFPIAPRPVQAGAGWPLLIAIALAVAAAVSGYRGCERVPAHDKNSAGNG